MIGRFAYVLIGVLLLVPSCGPAARSSSVLVDASAVDEDAEPTFEAVAVGDVPVDEMVAAGAAESVGGGLVLVAAGLDSLTVRWDDSVAPDATGFRLRWRPRRAGDDKDVWSAADLDASAREYTIEGLEAGWRYRLVLFAVGGDDVTAQVAVADFFTLATAVRNLSAKATAHDAVRLRWRSPAGWSPVGYVVQWRRGTPGPFIGSASLPPGTREHLVTGLDGDKRYVFRVTALTTRGWQSSPDAVRVRTRSATASPLRLEVSVPAYCLADEGRPDSSDFDRETLDPVWDRIGVASVRLQWRLSGGTGPYRLTVLGTERQGATGTVDVSCARVGADFSDPEADLVSSGAKTFTITAADAAGNTTTRTVSVEIIEDVDSAGNWNKGDTLQPGHIYSHRDRFFIEIPEGTRIGYSGSLFASPAPGAPRDLPTGFDQFKASSNPTRITRLLIVAGTSQQGPPELSREVCHVNEGGGSRCAYREPLTDAENEMWDRFLANIRTTPFPEGDPRNEPPTPLFPDTDRPQSSDATPTCYSRTGELLADDTGRWLPYGALPANPLNLHGIPCEIAVGPHPSLLVGDPITVCVEGGARDGLLVPAITAATSEWNNLLAPNHNNPDPSMRQGLGYAPLAFDAAKPACPTGLEDTDTDYIRVFDLRSCHAGTAQSCTTPTGTAGTAGNDISGDPPRVGGNRLRILASLAMDHAGIGKELERILRHELAHFLGLADYDHGCWRLVDTGGAVEPSIMSYGPDPGGQPDGSPDLAGCFSATIMERDLADLHAIHHPPAVENLTLTSVDGRWWLIHWDDSAEFPAEYNTTWTAVLARSTFTRDPATGALTTPPAAWHYINHRSPSLRHYLFPPPADLAGFEYTVANMTRGDHLRLRGTPGVGLGVAHNSLTLPSDPRRPWGLGSESTTVTAPEPVGRYTFGFDGFGQVHFGEDRPGAWRFSVYGYDTTRHGIPLDAGDLLISRQPANTGDADPFEPATFAPFTLTYGATTLNVTACRTRGFRDGRYLCHITTDLPLDPDAVPLRLVVASTPDATRTSPLAGSHPVQRNTVGFVNYGSTTQGDWRFAFWGRTITGLRVTHGGPVTLRPGDTVISHARPWGPNGFADSPFAAGTFTPLRITYGATTVDAAGCTTHFYNVDRYECHIASAFTFDTDNIPDHVAVNRRFTPRPQPPRAASEGQPPNPDSTSTTCTTTPTTPCQAN
ncbi:MAG: fibronectin type III domain-containing protein [bacterium]|nr:fibronectin type III domain-containing protein [bacterium]